MEAPVMIERTGKSVEEAIDNGLKQLGLNRAQVTVEVLSEGSKGLFGLVGGKPARVRLWSRTEAIGAARRFLEDLVSLMCPGATVGEAYDESVVRFEVRGRNVGGIIGTKGQTLDAIQHLTNLVARRAVRRKRLPGVGATEAESREDEEQEEWAGATATDGESKPSSEDRLRIIVDAEGYRARRKEALEGLARRMAERAVHEGKEVKLEPMSALERRIVHLALAGHGMVSTHSEGEEPFRRVIITPKT